MPCVIVSGQALVREGTGVSAYGRRLTTGLLRAGEGRLDVLLALPADGAAASIPGFPEAGVIRVPARRPANQVLDEALWDRAVSRCVRRRFPGAIFFSPRGYWSPTPPVRTVVAHHDCIHHSFPQYLGRKVVRKWLAKRRDGALSGCSAVVTESHHARQDIVRLLGVREDLVHVIPAWLPPEYSPRAAGRLSSEVRRRYGLPPRFWLYIGGYDIRKNIEFLLGAYASARQQGDCLPLVLAGAIPRDLSKPVCDVYSALSRLQLDRGTVPLPGFIADEDMPGLYAAAELLIYPSLYEGFGLPPLEAMGCGCPALVADCTSLPEVVRDPDYRFKGTEPESLAALLRRAAKEPLRLNPSFTAGDFAEGPAMSRYVDLFLSLVDSE